MRLLVALACFWMVSTACASPRPPATLAPPAGCDYAPLPLRVQLDAEVADVGPAVFAAAESWTRAMGTPAAIFVHLDPDVTVVRGLGSFEDLTTTRCEGRRTASVITLSAGLDRHAVEYFAMHGLGHALGVAHSTNQQSVMQAELDVALMGGEAGPDALERHGYRVTEHDARAVLALRRASR